MAKRMMNVHGSHGDYNKFQTNGPVRIVSAQNLPLLHFLVTEEEPRTEAN